MHFVFGPCSTIVASEKRRERGEEGGGGGGGVLKDGSRCRESPERSVRCKTRRDPSLNARGSAFMERDTYGSCCFKKPQGRHLAVDAAAHFLSCEFTTWHIHHTHQTWNIITQSLQRHTIFHSSK